MRFLERGGGSDATNNVWPSFLSPARWSIHHGRPTYHTTIDRIDRLQLSFRSFCELGKRKTNSLPLFHSASCFKQFEPSRGDNSSSSNINVNAYLRRPEHCPPSHGGGYKRTLQSRPPSTPPSDERISLGLIQRNCPNILSSRRWTW